MGMFDCVDYAMKCPVCGVMLDDFQTKDTQCSLESVSLSEVNYFYTSCGNCGTWVEFRRNRTSDIKDFTMEVSKVKK
jgi:transcription elongation factor Elf1